MKIYKIRYCAFSAFGRPENEVIFTLPIVRRFLHISDRIKNTAKNRIQTRILRLLKYGDFTTPTLLQMLLTS